MSFRAARRTLPLQALHTVRVAAIPLRHTLTPALSTGRSSFSPYFLSVRAQSNDSKAPPKLSKESPPKPYSYEDIKALITNPDPNKLIVDVREPAEYKDGAIPTAVNIPYKSTPGALDLSPEEFEEVFKFKKPSKDKELIFYCLAGVRSTAAADLAQIFGYTKLGNYKGSWEDWVAHENPEPVAEEPEKKSE
ncbi:CYFA0S14e01706g1_1 [Cyberlindnera fabianii]|uniref:CYFA0S14e01706g1_1 n=1 Tax=Cyberlindnera fabianii TaxID=36022 RepID=A0A061BBH3_CYBFA|nr:Thiosulfate sulfurtransferase RDL2, mitochondrial [Cyberlindnera fabianii]CDR44289.1 CYFA0S14e01706g1_1 [Cyberlindnera fabianii]